MTKRSVEDYDDIIALSRPESDRHARMPRMARAAQFSPFAALTGFEEEIAETGRETEQKIELDEDGKQQLNEMLQIVERSIGEHPTVEVCYYIPDKKKLGGAYLKKRGAVRKIDAVFRRLVFMDREEIPIDAIIQICILQGKD